jgi:hypothetical protein
VMDFIECSIFDFFCDSGTADLCPSSISCAVFSAAMSLSTTHGLGVYPRLVPYATSTCCVLVSRGRGRWALQRRICSLNSSVSLDLNEAWLAAFLNQE